MFHSNTFPKTNCHTADRIHGDAWVWLSTKFRNAGFVDESIVEEVKKYPHKASFSGPMCTVQVQISTNMYSNTICQVDIWTNSQSSNGIGLSQVYFWFTLGYMYVAWSIVHIKIIVQRSNQRPPAKMMIFSESDSRFMPLRSKQLVSLRLWSHSINP